MIKFTYKGSTYELSLEVKSSQLIFTIAMIVALMKIVSPEKPDNDFKHSVESCKKLIITKMLSIPQSLVEVEKD